MEKKIKFFINDANITGAILSLSFSAIPTITFFIIGIFIKDFIFVGYIFLGVFVLLAVIILIVCFVCTWRLEIEKECLTYKNFFGKIMLRHSMAELRGIEIRTLPTEFLVGLIYRQRYGKYIEAMDTNYFLFNFSDSPIEETVANKIIKNKNAMMLKYSPKNEKKLKQLIDMPIIDNREIEDTTWTFFRGH